MRYFCLNNLFNLDKTHLIILFFYSSYYIAEQNCFYLYSVCVPSIHYRYLKYITRIKILRSVLYDYVTVYKNIFTIEKIL